MDLLTDTYKMIAASNLSIKKIARGSDVGERWLQKLVKGVWKDPGVRKVNRIYLFLKTGEIQQEHPNGSTDDAGNTTQTSAGCGSKVSEASSERANTHVGDSPVAS